jgi:hypothetical protein
LFGFVIQSPGKVIENLHLPKATGQELRGCKWKSLTLILRHDPGFFSPGRLEG